MKTEIKVEGMSCGHCVSAVTEILKEVEGVEDVNVSLESKMATVEGDMTKDALLKALNETPYKGF